MVEKSKKNLNLVTAAENFETQELESSDLRKIALNLLKYSEGTKILLQEIDLVIDDLKL